jgi:uncharacterized alkaline shock family protein YloU
VAQTELKASLPHDDLDGDVIIADTVIAKLAGRAARHTYGVVDMHRSPVTALKRIFRAGSVAAGVEVDVHEGQARIGLHVIMERGLKLAEVTDTLEQQVRFEVERVAGVKVSEVNVSVEDVRT